MKFITALMLFASVTNAQDEGEVEEKIYDYNKNGEDWPTNWDTCGGEGQSPINLKIGENEYNMYEIADDRFSKIYSNQRDVDVKFYKGHTTKVELKSFPNYFMSDLGEKLYGDYSPEDGTKDDPSVFKYKGSQFHFHHESEHTVEGQHMDLEMHTVHFPEAIPKVGNKEPPKSMYVAAAIGILFSEKDYNIELTRAEQMVIDTFFETLDLTNMEEPKVNFASYGNLMNMVDFQNRWIYRGSVTTPPCATPVYWNVLKTIYPVKKKHLDQIKGQLERGTKGTAQKGNNRLVIEEDNVHSPFSVRSQFVPSQVAAKDVYYNIDLNIYSQKVGKGQCPSASALPGN